MFSLTRIIAVGALTLAVGGTLVVARPFDRREEVAPAAETGAEPAAPVEFTGAGSAGTCEVPATTDAEGPVAHTRGASCSPIFSFSDPRLQGTVSLVTNDDEYTDGSGLVIQSVAMSIENEEGAWKMVPVLSVDAPGALEYDAIQQAFLVGEGAYDGLIAVVEGFRTDELHGFIIDGELPPPPENAYLDR